MVNHYYSKILFRLQDCQLGPLGASFFHFLHPAPYPASYATNNNLGSTPLPEAV